MTELTKLQARIRADMELEAEWASYRAAYEACAGPQGPRDGCRDGYSCYRHHLGAPRNEEKVLSLSSLRDALLKLSGNELAAT